MRGRSARITQKANGPCSTQAETGRKAGVENDSVLAPDGTVITLAGTVDRGFRVYTPATNTWTVLVPTPLNIPISDFPRIVKFADGALLAFGGSQTVDGAARADAFTLGCKVVSEATDCGTDNYCNDLGAGSIAACLPKIRRALAREPGLQSCA